MLPWTHETSSSYPSYWTVSLALEMVRIQTALQTCSHEEADTQMLVHVKDTKLVMIRTVDTDILC